MTCFQIPGGNGEVVLETIIRIGPTDSLPYGYMFEVTCQHGVQFSVVAKFQPGADAGAKLECLRTLEDYQHQLHVAINTLTKI